MKDSGQGYSRTRSILQKSRALFDFSPPDIDPIQYRVLVTWSLTKAVFRSDGFQSPSGKFNNSQSRDSQSYKEVRAGIEIHRRRILFSQILSWRCVYHKPYPMRVSAIWGIHRQATISQPDGEIPLVGRDLSQKWSWQETSAVNADWDISFSNSGNFSFLDLSPTYLLRTRYKARRSPSSSRTKSNRHIWDNIFFNFSFRCEDRACSEQDPFARIRCEIPSCYWEMDGP